MFDPGEILSPLQRLAIVYARRDVREAFVALLVFDAKLRNIVAKSSEILVCQLKLAWWRDAIRANPDRRPKGEPFFAQIEALERNEISAELLLLLDAWEILLVDGGTDDALARFASNRSVAIFGGYQRLVHCDANMHELGKAWAKSDLTGSICEQASEKITFPSSRLLRPLTILAKSASGVSGPRLIWHALTGR